MVNIWRKAESGCGLGAMCRRHDWWKCGNSGSKSHSSSNELNLNFESLGLTLFWLLDWCPVLAQLVVRNELKPSTAKSRHVKVDLMEVSELLHTCSQHQFFGLSRVHEISQLRHEHLTNAGT